MGERYYLVVATAMALISLGFACAEGSVEESLSGQNNDAPPDSWRLIITLADGTTETHFSADKPIICGSQEEPKVIFFCGTGEVDGNPIAWDFLPVNIGAGDTYVIEPPGGPTATPGWDAPTPTVIGP
jgi:hypothetical protein